MAVSAGGCLGHVIQVLSSLIGNGIWGLSNPIVLYQFPHGNFRYTKFGLLATLK